MQFLPNLENYEKYPETKSCYLDAGYFNKVFQNYHGLIEEPLNIELGPEGFFAHMKKCHVKKGSHVRLIRVMIKTPGGLHATLLIVEPSLNKAFWFDPFKSEFDSLIKQIIAKYFQIEVVHLDQKAPEIHTQGCEHSGYCTGYIVKFAHDYLKHKQPMLHKIKSLCSMIEQEFPLEEHEMMGETYGWLNDGFTSGEKGALIGGLLGVLVAVPLIALTGGVAAIPLLLGLGALGAVGGYGIGSSY